MCRYPSMNDPTCKTPPPATVDDDGQPSSTTTAMTMTPPPVVSPPLSPVHTSVVDVVAVADDTVAPLQRRAVTPPVQELEDNINGLRRVSFTANQVFSVRTALSCLKSLDQRRQLWYNREDIQVFRRDAQIASKKLRRGISNSTTTTTVRYNNDDSDSDSDSDGDEDEEDKVCTRGLELRASLQRQDRKQQIVKRVLAAQANHATPEEVGRIAREHAIFSRKLAQAQAHTDYYAAYHPHLLLSTSLSCRVLPTSTESSTPTLTNHKRSLWGSPQPTAVGRRVRCRMY